MKRLIRPSIATFFSYFRPYAGLIVITFFFLIASQVATTLQPIFLRNIINAITSHETLRAITSILIIYFALKGAEVVSDLLRDYFFSPAEMGVSRDFELAVFRHLLDLPVSYHADQRSGAASRAVTRGSRAITLILDFTVSQLLPPVFQLIFVMVLLFRLYSPIYGITTLVSVIVYTWFTIWGTERRQKYRIEGNEKDDAASGVFVDAVSNIDTVKYFGNDAVMFRDFRRLKNDWFHLFTRNNRLFAVIYSGQGLILSTGLGIILYFAVRQAAAGTMTVGDLVLVSTYIVQLAAPITVLGFVYGNFKNSFADLDAMTQILAEPVALEEPAHPQTISEPKGRITFDHVRFRYHERKEVVHDLNLTIDPGQKIAFVGSSGAGKSTIAKLLFRLYDTTAGRILIDDVPVNELSTKTRADIMSIVPQEPALFNDTIANNITFGHPGATKDEVIAAAKAAHIHDFVMTLPDKYDTVVGERGIKISGGEKQRVAIARAIIKNPRILVFDEATSSLDTKSERAVLAAAEEVAAGRTTISIAHRLSTIVSSDKIYVLQHGRVVESGTHRELLANDGLYAQLWRLQSHAHESSEKQAA